jgi:hypothetical protein
MGMFDYVNCKMALPDGFEIDPADPFQTKDFRYLYDWDTGGTMSTCTIEEDGTLTYKLNPQYDHSNIIFTPPPNNINFYDLVQLDKFDWNDPHKLRRTLWVEYTAVIKDGKVIKIAMHPNHYAFEPMPYFEPSKALLKAYHRELEQESKIAEFVKKRMDHLNEVLDMIFNDGKNS